MRSALRLFTIVIAALVVSAVGAPPADATNSWGDYHWARTANPFTLQLQSKLTKTDWQAYLGTVSTDWSASAVLNTSVVAGSTKGGCKAVSGQASVCNSKYGFNGWLGLATIWISGTHITAGTVKVNDTYFNTSYYNNASAKRHVLCQEVGHTLGLDHQHLIDLGGGVTCMNDTAGLFDPAYVSPNAHDYDELALIYAHLDDTTTVGPSSATTGAGVGAGDDEDAVPPWAGPQHGSTFVKDLGGGRRLVTHVFWAKR